MPQNNPCVIRYEYDALNRIKKVTLEQKVEITYEYDAAGNITLVESQERPSGGEGDAGS